jgi:uncharacterized protein YbaR (Trm112 family)
VLIVLTDVLCCPRCGPEFGLIVLADRLEQRRILAGRLGCPNCREAFAIRGGVADLRFPSVAVEAREEPVPASPAGVEEEEVGALRIAALLGLTSGPGLVVLLGEPALVAGAVARLVPEISVAAAGLHVSELAEQGAVSRLLITDRLPFRTGSVRGVAVGRGSSTSLAEAMRVVARGGRIVVEGAPNEPIEPLRAAGFEVLLEQDGVVVAMR